MRRNQQDASKTQDWFLVTVELSTHKQWRIRDAQGFVIMDGFSSEGEAREWAKQSGFLPLPKVAQ